MRPFPLRHMLGRFPTARPAYRARLRGRSEAKACSIGSEGVFDRKRRRVRSCALRCILRLAGGVARLPPRSC
eukprot:12000580-Alexandrium_andersonii.AAC.1